MSGIVTKWVVLREHPVDPSDLADGGTVSDEAVQRWMIDARSAYLDRCGAVRRAAEAGRVLQFRTGTVPRGARLGRPDTVAVSTGVAEVRPSSFTIAVRLRPLGDGAGAVVNATCAVQLAESADGDPTELGTEISDELIALEQAAEHYN